ncbi:DUF177 domain-containing protein [Candidatus Sumerlaeota bacterium]|nr:DUF177 domain-containing protein [Candidatus Sumerlaeota bacterium]
MLKIAIDRLLEGPETVAINAPPSDFDLDIHEFKFTSPVRGEIEFKLIGHDVQGTGGLATDATAPCARCLEPVHVHLNVPIDNLWLQRTEMPGGEPDPREDETVADFFSGDYLEPTDTLRELILSELPVLARCSESCKGICPGCGANLNHERCRCAKKPEPAREAAPSDWKSALSQLKIPKDGKPA